MSMVKWKKVRLDEVANIQSGYAFKSKDFTPEGVAVLKISNIGKSSRAKNVSRIPQDLLIGLERFKLNNGDIVVAMSGATTGKFDVFKSDEENYLNQRVGRINAKCPEELDQKYLFYYFYILKKEIENKAYGAAQPNISPKEIAAFVIPIPPLTEQRRIVQRIESLFSRLDAGVASLQHAKAQLQRYRQSVFTAAVTGELTQAWRRANPDTEPASKLLKRILQQRREQWNGRGKYMGPALIREITLNSPESWLTTNIDSCISAIEAGSNFTCEGRPPKQDETGLVKISAVTWGTFNEEESKTVTDETRIKEDYLIHSGDFLLSRANTLELVGAPVIVTKITKRLMLSDKVLRLKISQAQEEWLLLWLRSIQGRLEIESRATGNQLSMRNISQKNIRDIPVPLPPCEEQQHIVAEVETRTSSIDHLEAELDQQLIRATKLRQSVLASKLTP